MNRKKALLIYNPMAGNGQFSGQLDTVIKGFQHKGFHLDIHRLSSFEELHHFFDSVESDAYDRIITAGGDGTIHQVMNELMKRDIRSAFGVFPVGTANDFAEYFELPRAVDAATEILTGDHVTRCDVGMANDRYFINIASMGFLIDISQRIDPWAKSNLGVLAYYLKGIEEFPRMKPIRVTIRGEGFRYDEEIYFMLILNGRSAGGFRKIGPYASMTDGLLDVCVFRACPVMEVMPLMIQLMNGEHVNNPNLLYFQAADMMVETEDSIGTDLDGEKGFDFPLHIRCLPRRIRIITRYPHESGFDSSAPYRYQDVKQAFDKVAEAMSEGGLRDDIGNLTELLQAIPHHLPGELGRQRQVDEEFDAAVAETLENGYLYLVIIRTQIKGSDGYCGIYISFDEELDTIVGFDGSEHIYEPGLNPDMIEYFSKKPDASIRIYRLKANAERKRTAMEAVRRRAPEILAEIAESEIEGQCEGVDCSFSARFVYRVLKEAGLAYFEKDVKQVLPVDFVELDSSYTLEYCGNMFHKKEDK